MQMNRIKEVIGVALTASLHYSSPPSFLFFKNFLREE